MSLTSKIIRFDTEGTSTKHILLCGDKNYIKYCGVTLTSILLSNPNENFTFHIFCDDISEQDLDKAKTTANNFKTNIIIYIFDKTFIEKFLIKLTQTNNVTEGKVSFYQCFDFLALDVLYDNKVDYVLYLDSDILVRGNISEFWKYKNTDYVAVVVEDKAGDKEAKRVNVEKYFNSGVLFINLKKWKESDYAKKAIYKASEKRWQYLDQDVLNILFEGKVLFISNDYNYYYGLSKIIEDYKKPSSINIPKDVSIVHFIGASKPWHSWTQSVKVVKEYNKVREKSYWNNNKIITPDMMKNKKYKYYHKAARVAKKENEFVACIENYFFYIIEKVKYILTK